MGKFAQIKNRQHVHVACLMTSEFFKVQLRSLDQKAPPTRSTDSPPSPPVSTVKACDTQALLLIPLISTASASSSSPSSSALCASCSAFQTTGGFTCQLLINLKTKGLLSSCGHRRKSLFNCAMRGLIGARGHGCTRMHSPSQK